MKQFVKLQAENKQMTDRLKRKNDEEEAEARTLTNTSDLDRFIATGGDNKQGGTNALELARRIKVVSHKYKTEKARNVEIMTRLKTLHEQALNTRDTKAQYARYDTMMR